MQNVHRIEWPCMISPTVTFMQH